MFGQASHLIEHLFTVSQLPMPKHRLVNWPSVPSDARSPGTLQALRLTISGSWGTVTDVELSPFCYTAGCNAYRVWCERMDSNHRAFQKGFTVPRNRPLCHSHIWWVRLSHIYRISNSPSPCLSSTRTAVTTLLRYMR